MGSASDFQADTGWMPWRSADPIPWHSAHRLAQKNPLAAPGVAGLLEITRGKEIDEQVRGLLLAQLGPGDSLAFHGGPHDGSVVPQQARQDVGAEAPLRAPPQVRRALSALSVDAVARPRNSGCGIPPCHGPHRQAAGSWWHKSRYNRRRLRRANLKVASSFEVGRNGAPPASPQFLPCRKCKAAPGTAPGPPESVGNQARG